MKSDKGIAMLSLVIYVASFLIITTLVGTISTYFYNNMDLVTTNVGGNSEYNKLNLYIAKLVKDNNLDYVIANGKCDTDGVNEYSTILFYNKVNPLLPTILTRKGDYIYYNEILLCSNVSNFTATVVEKNGKSVLVVNVKLSESSFTTEYVIG